MKFVKFARWGGGLLAAALLLPALAAAAPAANAATTASGRPAVVQPLTTSRAFLLKPDGTGISLDGGGGFDIFNNDAGRCIGIANGNAGIWDCTGNPDQTWYTANETSTGITQLVNGNGVCLATADGTANNGVGVVARSCNNTVSDQFWHGLNGHILNMAGCDSTWTLCTQLLTVLNGSTANGAPLVMWNGNDNNPAHNWTW